MATLGTDGEEPVVEGPTVQAAGGLLVRRGRGGTEVAVVHRPVHGDWSFPKGKLEAGESFEDAALREVREETGMWCRLGRFLGHVEYRDRKDRPKVVAYWTMEPEVGSFTPNAEVDELRWVGLGAAGALLSYERDRLLLDLLDRPDPTGLADRPDPGDPAGAGSPTG
jgi:8-oxo-dGTP diphosphatase